MLSLTHNISTRRTTLTPGVDAILKRSHSELLIVKLRADDVAHELGADDQVLFILKPRHARDDSLLVNDGDDHGVLITTADWQPDTEDYRKVLDLYTVPVNTLLNVDGDPDNDITSAECSAEICYRTDDDEEWEPGSTLECIMENAVIAEEDGTPDSVADPLETYVAVVAQTFTSGEQLQARTNIAAAPLASPTFTGTPAAPTAANGTNTTQLATTAFVTVANAQANSSITPAANGTYPNPTSITIQNGIITAIS